MMNQINHAKTIPCRKASAAALLQLLALGEQEIREGRGIQQEQVFADLERRLRATRK
jgi:hypothetical protein